jgi:ABC-type methionine transport system ATPase subunit
MGSRILKMSNGRIVQDGSVEEVFGTHNRRIGDSRQDPKEAAADTADETPEEDAPGTTSA